MACEKIINLSKFGPPYSKNVGREMYYWITLNVQLNQIHTVI